MSGLLFFGNRSDMIHDILGCLEPERQFETLFDVFCGSASISLATAEMQLSKHHVCNDRCCAIINLLQAIQDEPESLSDLINGHLKRLNDTPKSQEKYYEAFKKVFQSTPKPKDLSQAAVFFMLLLFAKSHMPTFDRDGQFTAVPEFSEKLLHLDVSTYIKELSTSLSKSRGFTFVGDDFLALVKRATPHDLVILDPPYPDLPESTEENTYQYFEERRAFDSRLRTAIQHLNDAGVPWLMFYGTADAGREFLLPEHTDYTHLVRLGEHPQFGRYAEHIYAHNSLRPKLFALPQNIQLYDPAKHQNNRIAADNWAHQIRCSNR